MRAAVIGGGISGIATAFYLMQRNIEVDLYESAPRIGGRIGSERLDNRWVDFGGKNVGKNYRRFREFVTACGIADYEYFGFNTSQIINGRVVRINKEGARLLNTLRFMSLCGFDGIRKLYPHVQAILKDRSQGVLNSDYFNRVADKFDHTSLAGYLKEPCLSHIARPVTVRMNGAEPDECSPGNFGSNLALVLDSYEQLKPDMHGMLDAFQEFAVEGSLRILSGHRVTSLSRDPGSPLIKLGYLHQGVAETAVYDRVISALPALRLGFLLEGILPQASALLRKVRYYPVAIAIVKYHHNVFTSSQRAMVFDHTYPLSNAGAYGINDLNLVRYTFSGRASRSVISETTSAEEVIALGESIAGPWFSIRDNQRESFAYRYITEGLCAYSPMHYRLLHEIDQQLDQFAGFGATGDYRRGASIEACFRAAGECVETLLRDKH
nr:FAD-dependent oxidoreductase [Chlorobium sp. KB01]